MADYEVAEFIGGPMDGKTGNVIVGAHGWTIRTPQAPPSYRVINPLSGVFMPPRWGMRIHHYERYGRMPNGRMTFRYKG